MYMAEHVEHASGPLDIALPRTQNYVLARRDGIANRTGVVQELRRLLDLRRIDVPEVDPDLLEQRVSARVDRVMVRADRGVGGEGDTDVCVLRRHDAADRLILVDV